MHKKCIPVFLMVFLSSLPFALGSDVEGTFSPKLGKYLADNPPARQVLTNVLSKVFTGRTVRIFYSYSNDAAEPRAFHTYPDTSVVWICVRENQDPCDEFITMLFEAVNSKGEDTFRRLFREAQAKSVSKAEFARRVLWVEFEAVKETRNLLRALSLNEWDKKESYYYNRFARCPDDFEGFLVYSKEVSPGRDVLKEYESKYDALRKAR